MKENIEHLLEDKESSKQTKYLEISPSNFEKNNIKLKNALRDVNVSDELDSKIADILKDPHLVPSMGLFIENGALIDVKKVLYPFEDSFEFTKFYTLPLFDYRNIVFENLYLLNFSQKQLSFYNVSYDKIENVSHKIDTYEEYIKNRIENKSIQRHGGEKGGFHGQNAASEKDRERNIEKTYISTAATELTTMLEKLDNPKLVIMASSEHVEALKKEIPKKYLTKFEIHGNFEHFSDIELADKLRSVIEESEASIFKSELESEIDQSMSNDLQSKDFSHILSFVKEGKVEKLYIGELGDDDSDYNNPVAPSGANYISHEVLKLGGEVVYYPNTKFEFSDNNIAFKFRY